MTVDRSGRGEDQREGGGMTDEEFADWLDENWHFTAGDLLFLVIVSAVISLAVWAS